MRKITVKVKANAKENKLEWKAVDSCHIWTTAPARDGKANKAVVDILSEELNISRSSVLILKGEKNSKKLIGVLSS